MEYVTLGKSGLRISRLGFGGIPIQKIDAEGTKTLVDRMIRAGINFIDTARGYTVSEEYLGYALEGRREQFVLATKSPAKTREAMAADIERSLHNLRTDYIDLYQLHNPKPADLDAIIAPGGALDALLEAKEAGKIGHIGITAHVAEVFTRALDFPWVETIMFPYNIVETQCEDLIHECHVRNIGFIDMKPLAGGAIEDARLAIRFVCTNPDVTVVIPGMYDIAEMEENLRAAEDSAPLSKDEEDKIEEIRKDLGSNFCRRCNYCAPCAVGIQIPSVFVFAGYLERYGLESWARERYGTLPVKAGACIRCGACEPRCPYNLPIREMMKASAEAFGE